MEKSRMLDEAQTLLLEVGFGNLDQVDILDDLLNHTVLGVGTAIDEILLTPTAIKDMVKRQKEQSAGLNTNYSFSEVFRFISPTGHSALVFGNIRIRFAMNGENHEIYFRFSTVFEWIDDKWKCIHFHASKPENVETEKDTYGIEDWKQKTIELEQLVSERTAELVQKNQELSNTISQLKSTQAQLIQSEKMASLGELTAGIAHEIQNPLNFVNNFSEVSKELIGEMKSERSKVKGERNEGLEEELLNDIAQNLEKINHHGKRADAIVKGMLQHSRTSTGQKEPTDINALCDEYVRLAYHGLKAKDKSFNATYITDFDPDIHLIQIIPQDIGRVLLNLINNAFYAVHEKMKAGKDGYKPEVIVSSEEKEGFVKLSVSDNGNGIPEAIREKIFQPFFTTKPTGEGTGLGLSLSYDIVKAHGGELKMTSETGKGTGFAIYLPI